MTKRRSKFEQAKSRLSHRAQRIAERQARIPAPEHLREAITRYIEWHAFAYWTRLINETQDPASTGLHQILEERCPGFLASVAEYAKRHPDEPEFLWLRLISWIDNQIFAFAREEGWSDALSYYAARDPRMDRLLAYWQECDIAWRNARPVVLPRFEQWRDRAI
ncbi:MAG: hypothetical protein ACRD4Q_09495 [Candidatus Acidiferrales bacterium]